MKKLIASLLFTAILGIAGMSQQKDIRVIKHVSYSVQAQYQHSDFV
jgi:hypothetical protein